MPTSSRRPLRGEFEALAKARSVVEKMGRDKDVLVGIGDDCAVVKTRPGRSGKGRSTAPVHLLTTDAMVEGTHFERSWLTASELGARAFRAAASDISAMGGMPRQVLLSLELSSDLDLERTVLALTKSVATQARQIGATLVGGNVSAAAHVALTITVVGQCTAPPVLRSGAKVGDLVFVTGRFGGAAAGWRTLAADKRKALGFAPRPSRGGSATIAYRRPPLRMEFASALAERGLAHAMIDVSDGLLQDLEHLARESRVSIAVDALAVPVHPAAVRFARSSKPERGAAGLCAGGISPALVMALTGGEDYELAFTASPSHRERIWKVAKEHRVPLTLLGTVRRGSATVTDENGEEFSLATYGFDHGREATARASRSTSGASATRGSLGGRRR